MAATSPCIMAAWPSRSPAGTGPRGPVALHPGPTRLPGPAGTPQAAAPPTKGESAQSHRDGQAARGCRAISGQRPLSFLRGEEPHGNRAPETLQKHPEKSGARPPRTRRHGRLRPRDWRHPKADRRRLRFSASPSVMAVLGFNPPNLGTRSLQACGKSKEREPRPIRARQGASRERRARTPGGTRSWWLCASRAAPEDHGRALVRQSRLLARPALTCTGGVLGGHQATCSHVGTGANAVGSCRAPQQTSATRPRGPDLGGGLAAAGRGSNAGSPLCYSLAWSPAGSPVPRGPPSTASTCRNHRATWKSRASAGGAESRLNTSTSAWDREKPWT